MADSVILSGGGISVEIGAPGGIMTIADNGYQPAAAPMRLDAYGNEPPFAEVKESITIAASGTLAQITAALAELSELALYVQRWGIGAEQSTSGTPKMTWIVNGSALTSGVVADLRWMEVRLNRDFKSIGRQSSTTKHIYPIEITITRSGWLCGTSENKTGTFTYPTPLELSFTATSADLPSPVIAFLSLSRAPGATAGFFILAEVAAHVKHSEAEVWTAVSGSPASTALSGASGGYVYRATASFVIKNGGFGFTKAGTYEVLIKVDNDTAGDWLVQAHGYSVGPSGQTINEVAGPVKLITSAVSAPTVFHCGSLTLSEPLDVAKLTFTKVSGSGNFDLDDVLIIYRTDRTRIVYHDAMTTNIGSGTQTLIWSSGWLVRTHPTIKVLDSDNNADYGAVYGDAMPVALGTAALFWYSCGTSSFLYNNAAYAHTATLTRYPAYLLPE